MILWLEFPKLCWIKIKACISWNLLWGKFCFIRMLAELYLELKPFILVISYLHIVHGVTKSWTRLSDEYFFFLCLFLLGISWWSLEDTALLTIWHLLFYFLKQQCSFLIAQGFLSKKSHCPLASLRESDPLKVPLNLINITGQVPLETVLTSPVTQFHQLRQD